MGITVSLSHISDSKFKKYKLCIVLSMELGITGMELNGIESVNRMHQSAHPRNSFARKCIFMKIDMLKKNL